ncbi:uncharacterized protein LOC107046611 [Diachasma alloeum]|uniref:uncharacterized protein LOC107046611 n=1 Tax=Diachasma alloeum TaxID=454923 RepID=UPI0007383DDA|nr:uncharacterized protein LOC107046611 [Diachasma alloeum]
MEALVDQSRESVETLITDTIDARKNLLGVFEDIAEGMDTINRNVSCGKENCIDRPPAVATDDDFAEERSIEDLQTTKSVSHAALECQDEFTQTSSEFEDKNTQTTSLESTEKGVQVQSGDILMPFSMCIMTDRHLNVMCGIRNHAILNELVALISELYPEVRAHKMTLKDRVILTTMKLKLNLPFSALGIMFKSVEEPTCRRIFHSMLPKLSEILKCTIRWVSREEIRRNIPKCFQHFQNTRVIVDCTEFRVHKPKCLQCRIKFYSQYKSNFTAKFMTGVSPGGMLTFLSKGYGGRASDKAIFQQSNIIDLVEKGDAVMTDKGFQIEDLCMNRGVQLFIPPFLKQKKQLSPAEAIYNRFIAAARVHVERMNQRIRDFGILQSTIPWNLIASTDDIVNVCAGLANLGTPIMTFDKFI